MAGGDESLDLIIVPDKKYDVVYRKHIVARKRKASGKEQACFEAASTSRTKRKKLHVDDCSLGIVELKQWMKRELVDLKA